MALTILVFMGCKEEQPKPDLTIEAKIVLFSVTSPISIEGVIDEAAKTISLKAPAGTDVTAFVVEVTVPNEATVSPESGSTVDFTNPATFTVTGADKDGNAVTQDYTASVTLKEPQIAFIGTATNIDGLEDDAKAAATFLSTTYGENFHYMPAADITAAGMAEMTVAVYYYLETGANNMFAEADVVAKASIIQDWAKKGGDLFLAGGGASLIFDIGRLPIADFDFLEKFGDAGVESGKPQDDYWGISLHYDAEGDCFGYGTNTSDLSEHPIFQNVINTQLISGDANCNGGADTEVNRVFLGNSDSREVQLVGWTNVGDFPSITAGCCGIEMIQEFEAQTRSRKLGSLRHVVDGWGFMFGEFEGTADGNNDATLNSNIPTDWKGNTIVLCNHIVGYEWDTSTDAVRTNEYDDNIQTLTTNIINYLASLNNN